MGKRGISFLLLAGALAAQAGGDVRFSIRADPKTFNPLLVSDHPSDTVRYLTAGTLIRINRHTHRLEPFLAESWRVSEGGLISVIARASNSLTARRSPAKTSYINGLAVEL